MAGKDHTSKTGFAAMDPERHQEIARRGGQTAHRLGKAHTFTPEQAREAGQKGGNLISRNRAHMAEIARKRVEARRRHTAAKRHHGQEP